jgi:hypothetical protein
LDWVGVSTPTIPEIDLSSATQSLRVISELVMTATRNTAARANRTMSLVRRSSGCSRLPATATSRPSTRIRSTYPGECDLERRWSPQRRIGAVLLDVLDAADGDAELFEVILAAVAFHQVRVESGPGRVESVVTPDLGEASAGGLPVLSATAEFLIKGVALLGISVWTRADALGAIRER